MYIIYKSYANLRHFEIIALAYFVRYNFNKPFLHMQYTHIYLY